MTNSRDKGTPDLQKALDGIVERMEGIAERGRVAAYIPELADVDLNQFGLAVAMLDGRNFAAGNAEVPFSIQSISKVFTLTLALRKVGATLWSRVGREPSGDPFNSIVQLEYDRGVPRNPFINPGAIVVSDVLLENRDATTTIDEIVGFCRELAGDGSVGIDEDVAASELRTGAKNRALAYFMAAEGNLKAPVEDVLSVYFNHCSIAMSCRQLARAGLFLAGGGLMPGSEERVISDERARRVTALMMTCGSYDASGEFAFRVGLPAKSGVGGGILGIVPGVAAITAWCPGLDAKGNSLLATAAFEDLVHQTGWSVFGPRG